MGVDDVEAMGVTLVADEVRSWPSPVVPTVLAERYEILGLLGAGGMGNVYRAMDRELGEAVALKVLHKDLVSSPAMIERFRQEVRLARKVTHRNVARTFDIGEHAGEKFLTMELVAGVSLSTHLSRAELTEGQTIAIAREIVAGMAAAHAVGVVHRDLKPDNVLIEEGGRVVVTDFGIARAEVANALGSVNRTNGLAIGTPAYMAPEQVSGRADVDARADTYAFGAMLFEMLTGSPAWPGTAALAVAVARLTEPVPDPRRHRPNMSQGLAEIVMRCLARDREHRFATDADLDQALASVDASRGTGAIPVTHEPLQEASKERSVAIVPFRNFGPPDDAYLVEGLTEDLVDVLATVRGLRVRGRAYVEAADRDVVDTGRRLGVDVVVDGSVRRAGDTLRVSARVIGVADGFQLWSSRFERSVGAAFAMNDEVAQAIATALATERTNEARPPATDTVAVELYFRAKHAMGRFWSVNVQREAQDLFKQALGRAPNDATILGGYILAQVGRNPYVTMDPSETAALVRRALEMGQHLPEPWVALAGARFNLFDDPVGAVRALKRALALGPSSSDAHDLAGRILLEADARAEAITLLERALWLDPRQRWARIDLMRTAAMNGEWTRAREFLDAKDADWQGHRLLHGARMWSWPGASPFELPPIPADVDGNLRALTELYARASGRRPWDLEKGTPAEQVKRDITQLLPQRSRGRRFISQMGAELMSLVGDPAGALDFVKLAVDHGLVDAGWMNRLRLLDPLRGDPTFETFRGAVNARAGQVLAAWRGPAETLEEAKATLG